MKFPVVDISDLRCNPDIRFADRYVEVMHIHDIQGQVILKTTEDLREGETLVVKRRVVGVLRGHGLYQDPWDTRRGRYSDRAGREDCFPSNPQARPH